MSNQADRPPEATPPTPPTIPPVLLAWATQVQETVPPHPYLERELLLQLAVVNAHGYRVDRLEVRHYSTLKQWGIKAWPVSRTNEFHPSFMCGSLSRVWNMFSTHFVKTRVCRVCTRTYNADAFGGVYEFESCPSCEVRKVLVVPITCPVCLADKVVHPMTLKCGHAFCRPCLETWRKRTCPMCRDPYHLQPGWDLVASSRHVDAQVLYDDNGEEVYDEDEYEDDEGDSDEDGGEVGELAFEDLQGQVRRVFGPAARFSAVHSSAEP